MTPAQQLAIKAGFEIVEHPQEPGNYTVISTWAHVLDQYADLIAQVERDICAKICETMQTHYPPREQLQAQICASTIRARGATIDPQLKSLVEQFKQTADYRTQYNQAVNSVAQECRHRIGNLKGYSGYIDGKVVDTPSWNAAVIAAQRIIREQFEEQYAN